MKTMKSTIKTLVCGLGLVAVLYNCKTKDVDSLTPFTYTFKGIENVKLPDAPATTPAAVSVTQGSVALSAQAMALSAGLGNIAATGQIPAAVTDATDAWSRVVSSQKAGAINAAFTPDVINNLAATGKLPENLKADVNAIATNTAMAPYMPLMSLPTVNGKPVGGRLAGPVTVAVVNTTLDAGTDACKAAANAAFTTAKNNLDTQFDAQKATVNASYELYVATANNEVAGCQSPVPAKYDALVATAQSQLSSALAALASARSVLGEERYALLTFYSYIAFSRIIEAYTTLEAAELNVCTQVKEAKIASAVAARNADLGTVTSNYNTTLATLTTARDKAIASCHNQGNGG